jgi:hypothetical protein
MRGGEELVLEFGICGGEADFSTSAANAPPAVETTTIFQGLRFGSA